MSELGYHVCLRLKEPRVIVSDAKERRTLARVVLEQGRSVGLLAFHMPDTHLHAALLCDRVGAGSFSQRVGSSLRQRLGLGVGFAQYEPKPIEDGRHLGNLVRYILCQPERHGVDADPFREASNLPDLLGLRDLGAHTIQTLRAWLPRLGRGELVQWLGVPGLEPCDGPPERVPEAALRATGLVSFRGRSNRTLAARRAAVAVLGRRLSVPWIVEQLCTNERSVCWLRAQSASPALVSAIRLQLGLEEQLGLLCSQDRPFQEGIIRAKL